MEFARMDKPRSEPARSSFLTLPTSASPAADLQTHNYRWTGDLNILSKFSGAMPVSPSTSNDSGYQESPPSHHRFTRFFPLMDDDQVDFYNLDDEVLLSEAFEDHENYQEHKGSVIPQNRTPNTSAWSAEMRAKVSSADICNALSEDVSRYSSQLNTSCKFAKKQMKLGDEALSDDVDADKVDNYVLTESLGPRRIRASKHRLRKLSGVRTELPGSDFISFGTDQEDDQMNLYDSVDLNCALERLIARRLALIGDDFDRQFRTNTMVSDIPVPDGVWIPVYACFKDLATRLCNFLTNLTTEPRRSSAPSCPCFRSTAS